MYSNLITEETYHHFCHILLARKCTGTQGEDRMKGQLIGITLEFCLYTHLSIFQSAGFSWSLPIPVSQRKNVFVVPKFTNFSLSFITLKLDTYSQLCSMFYLFLIYILFNLPLALICMIICDHPIELIIKVNFMLNWILIYWAWYILTTQFYVKLLISLNSHFSYSGLSIFLKFLLSFIYWHPGMPYQYTYISFQRFYGVSLFLHPWNIPHAIIQILNPDFFFKAHSRSHPKSSLASFYFSPHYLSSTIIFYDWLLLPHVDIQSLPYFFCNFSFFYLSPLWIHMDMKCNSFTTQMSLQSAYTSFSHFSCPHKLSRNTCKHCLYKY